MSEENITPDKLTKAYIKIRAERSALSAQFKEADGDLSRQLDRLKQAMLDHCERHNTLSVRIKEFLEENPTLVPDALNTETELVISVRKK